MTGTANAHLTAELARLPTAEQALVVGGSEADTSWLADRGWGVTTVDGDTPDWSPEAERYGLVVSLHVPVAGSTEDFVTRMGNAVKPGGTLFIVSQLVPGESQPTQSSSDDAIAALSDDPWDIIVAEERTRPTGDGVDSIFHAEKP